MRIPAALFFLVLCGSAAAAPNPWATLTGCRYVPHKNNDGDSFHVRCGADAFVLRLYFVDAPETNLLYPERTREQAEHFGATLDATLKAGAAARALVRDTLRGSFTVVTRKAAAGGRGKEPRYYAMVQVDGKGLDEILVLRGLARAKGVTATFPGEKGRAHAGRLKILEAQAKEKRRGIWGHAPHRP